MVLDPHRALASLLSSGPHPRLVWSNDSGERLELSGRVTANWAVKIANLLLEEAEAEPGTRVLLDLPVHWRTAVWALGTWLTGAAVVLPATDTAPGELPDGGVDVIVTTSPQGWVEKADLVVAVALPALALSWPGELPSSVLDGASDVAGYGDALGIVESSQGSDLALSVGEVEVRYSGAGGLDGSAEVGAVAGTLLAMLATWAEGEQVVLRG